MTSGLRVAVIGATGQLGHQLIRAYRAGGHDVIGLSRSDFDITDPSHMPRLSDWRPALVVNAAAWADVDGCARDPQRAMRVNGHAPGMLAEAAAAAGASIVQVSTNEVFDGSAQRPYAEDDEPNPINAYGAAKLEGERRVAAANPRHLIVRTAWLFCGRISGFPSRIARAARSAAEAGRPLPVVADEIGNPTPAPWLASAMAEVSVQGMTGVLHLAGEPAISRYDLATAILGREPVELVPISSSEYARPSRVPLRAVLSTARATALGIQPGDWRRAVDADQECGDSARR